ncbi:MAG: hypothetical protein ACKVLK_14290 [Spongiibacter sp.]
MMRLLRASKASVLAQVLAFFCLLLLEGVVDDAVLKNLFILLGLQRFSNLACGLRLELVSKINVWLMLLATAIMSFGFVQFLYLVEKYSTWSLLEKSSSSYFEIVVFFFASTVWNFVNFRAACLEWREALLIRVFRPTLFLCLILAIYFEAIPKNYLIWCVSISFILPAFGFLSKVLRSDRIGLISWERNYFVLNFLFSIFYLFLDIYVVVSIVDSKNYVEAFVFYRVLTVITTSLASNHRAIHIFTEGHGISGTLVSRCVGLLMALAAIIVLNIDISDSEFLIFLLILLFLTTSRLYFSIVSSEMMKLQNYTFVISAIILALAVNIALLLGYVGWQSVLAVPTALALIAILLSRSERA